ncbi:hypothetical protein LC724_14965 [Blautia sp. RD014234]|nr:hypothetical protein [Blautia parvula]
MAMALTGIMTAGLLAGCGSSGGTQADTAKDAKDEKQQIQEKILTAGEKRRLYCGIVWYLLR